MAAKTTSAGFSFLKEAQLLLMRIPKLLAPFLLFAVIGILHTAVRLVYVNPLTAKMSRHLTEMEDHTDHSSAEYVRLLEEAQDDATRVLTISIAIALVTLTVAFAKPIVARFAASCATYSGYSLAELLGEVTKWPNLKTPLIITAAVVTISQLLSVALLGGSFPTAIHDLGLLSLQGSLFLVAFQAFFFLGVMALTNVSVGRKEFAVMVLVTLLLPTLLIPVCAFGLLHLYTKPVMGLGPPLLSVYDLLQGVQDLLYLSAACVYCSYYQAEDMKESNKMVVACDGEKYTSSLNN